MKIFCCFVLIVTTSLKIAFAQTTKLYVSKDGRFSTDSVGAAYYLLREKKNDTSYFVRQYNLQNVIAAEGTFKDPELTISNGEFTYYKIQPASTRISYQYTMQKIDTIITPAKVYVSSKGTLINGSKYGVWTDFFSDGSPQYISTLRADTANGMHKVFYQPPHFFMYFGTNAALDLAGHRADILASIQGKYLDGRREGPWYSISKQGDTIAVDYYKHDKGIKSIDYLSEQRFQTHIKPGHPDYDLFNLLNRKPLKPIGDFSDGLLIIIFTLSKDGKISNPVVENVDDNFSVYNVVIPALLSFPDWKPTLLDDVAVESEIQLYIKYKRVGKSCQFIDDPGGINYAIPGYTGY